MTNSFRNICLSLGRFIRSFMRRGQQCFAFQKTIARYLGCSLRTIQRAIAALAAEGKLKVIRRGPQAAVYALVETANGQVSQPVGGLFGGSSGGSFGGSKPAGPINESEAESSQSPESSRREERRTMPAPAVVFLRADAGKTRTEEQKTLSLKERVLARFRAEGWAV